jgi:hypothetical protein
MGVAEIEVDSIGAVPRGRPANQGFGVTVAEPHFPIDRRSLQVETFELGATEAQTGAKLAEAQHNRIIRVNIAQRGIAADAKGPRINLAADERAVHYEPTRNIGGV